MLRFREACNGSSFYNLASLIKDLLVKTASASYYLKLSLPMFLKLLPNSSLVFLIKRNMYTRSDQLVRG